MTEKTSLHILLPGMNLEHNFLIPNNMKLREALSLIYRIFTEEYPGVDCRDVNSLALIQASTGMVLDNNASLDQMKLISGEPLILI